MTTFCPYCDGEIEDAICNEWVGDFGFDFECPICGKTLEISVEMRPYFNTYKKEEVPT